MKQMHPALQALERHGIVSEADYLRIGEFPAKKIFAIYGDVYRAVLDLQRKQFADHASSAVTLDPFSFVASAALRGDLGCGAVPCRLKKLDLLARYAALYANEVTVPLSLEEQTSRLGVTSARSMIARAAMTLTRLRPLIEARVVTPVIMRSFHCPHTIKWAKEMVEVVHAVADLESQDLSSEFRVVYQRPERAPTGRSTAYITGPEEFIEHGELVALFDESPGWRAKSWKFDRDGMTELRGDKKLAFLRRIFNEIADDTTFYLAYGRRKNARYLTDLRGEAFLLEGSTQDDEVSATNKAVGELLNHTVPLLGDLSIETLLRIRREERDSFLKYRSALNRVLKDVAGRQKHVGKREVRDLYKQVIEPQLIGMRAEMHQERRRQIRRIVGGLGTLAATVSLGIFGGVVPLVIKGTVAAAGAMVGGRLLSKAAEAQCEHGAMLKEKNDFYFLLRLTQETEVH